jgi:hypothetical protein
MGFGEDGKGELGTGSFIHESGKVLTNAHVVINGATLACRAYPVIESSPLTLDSKCKFCESCANTAENVNQELESLAKIKIKMETNAPFIWRYATGIGDQSDINKIHTGWILET